MEKRRRRPRRGRSVARGCGSWGTRGARAWSIRRDARAPMVGAPARWTWSTGGGARRRGPRGCVRDARLASRAFARTREGRAPVRGGRSATWRRPARARVRGRVPRPPLKEGHVSFGLTGIDAKFCGTPSANAPTIQTWTRRWREGHCHARARCERGSRSTSPLDERAVARREARASPPWIVLRAAAPARRPRPRLPPRSSRASRRRA